MTRDAVTFPRLGGIAYSSWADLARSNLPASNRPDIDHVAERFRNFCSRKGILLNSPRIEVTFTSFCKSWQLDD
jgi:hypothetical protein